MDKKLVRTAAAIVAIAAVAALVVVRLDDVAAVAGTLWDAAFPLVVGAIIAYVLNIAMSALERVWFPRSTNRLVIRTRRGVCAALAVLSIGLVISAVVWLVAGELKSAALAAAGGFAELAGMASAWLAQIPGFEGMALGDADTWRSALDAALASVGGTSQVVRIALQAGGEAVGVAAAALIGAVFALYLLIDKDRVLAGARRIASLLPGGAGGFLAHAATVANQCFARFVSGQCLEAVILGTLCALGCGILGFPYAGTIGLTVGITSLVPFVGAWVGGIVGAAMIFSHDPVQAVQFIVFLVVLQQVEGHLIYPNVVGQSVGLPGIWVFTAVVVGGALFGLAGVLLGVPCVSTARTLVMERFELLDRQAAERPRPSEGAESPEASASSEGADS